ncbi:ABC transporter ATP-binding protein [Lapidilactobacillus bayanensis]|uniref:ABC transporter ATP-binding protein n=1 Tax=Lapidilactobacillus bayanensis TaxID=2485998 RepID=UPI000F7706F3|nr:ABC transporter ATP-binding protein [Lapidilactobacillus bayanensis]
MKNPAVLIEQLSVTLGGNQIFDEANFKADYGKVTGLVGPNGSGKSVLFKIISGFVRGTGKNVIVNDEQLLRSTRFPPNVGSLIEEPYFIANLSGLDNLLLLASIKNLITEREIVAYLQKFGLPTDRQAVKTYSLGMKKKLAIIQAIMEQQTVVILDEPMNALDEHSAALTRQVIQDLAAVEHRAVLLTSHQSDDIKSLCQEVFEIQERRIIRQ